MAKELGDLGLLGMHLQGYGCAGTSAVAYGLACLELEAGDSGFRSFVSVQGSLAMYAIWAHGSEEQKATWLPRMAAGDAIGCFGLTEWDFGSDPGGMRTTARRDGSDYVLNGSKAWITNGGIADVAIVWARTDPEDGHRSGDDPRLRRAEGHEGLLDAQHRAQALAARVGHLGADLRGCRVPADAILPNVSGCAGRSRA